MVILDYSQPKNRWKNFKFILIIGLFFGFTLPLFCNTVSASTDTPQNVVTITFTSTMTIMPSVSVTIPVGGKVIWKNDDPFKPHDVQAIDNQLAQKYFGGVNPIQIPYGKTFEVTLNDVGAFDYTTVFQPQIVGKIVVVEVPAPPAVPTTVAPTPSRPPRKQR